MDKLDRNIRNTGNAGVAMPGGRNDGRANGTNGRSANSSVNIAANGNDGRAYSPDGRSANGVGIHTDGRSASHSAHSPDGRSANGAASHAANHTDNSPDGRSNNNSDSRGKREPGQRPVRRQAAGVGPQAAAGLGTETLRILLIEDDRAIRDAVLAYLESEGFLVTPCVDGEQALDCFANDSFDLIILDLMLPKISGEEVCQHIRGSSSIPIIILTAKDGVDDRINGLELGADDYLIKPFSPRELVARIRALLRRVAPPDAPPDETMPIGKLELGALIIDATARQASFYGEPIDLTSSEFKLLCVLGKDPGRVFTRAELSDRVLGYRFEEGHRSIDTHIKNLRYKLGEEPRSARWLVTVHGAGYRLDVADPLSGAQRRGA
jgi:DNA-binding response OmpR family regulator